MQLFSKKNDERQRPSRNVYDHTTIKQRMFNEIWGSIKSAGKRKARQWHLQLTFLSLSVCFALTTNKCKILLLGWWSTTRVPYFLRWQQTDETQKRTFRHTGKSSLWRINFLPLLCPLKLFHALNNLLATLISNQFQITITRKNRPFTKQPMLEASLGAFTSF